VAIKNNRPAPTAAKSPAEAGKSRLTLRDVALALGVSRTTVSNAYNRPAQLSEDLRTRVLDKSRELGYYGPDPMARALRRRDLHVVGVVFHHDLGYALSDPTSIEFLNGVARELDQRRLSLQLIPKMGRKLMLSAALNTTADALIVHAEIGPEFMPDVLTSPKPIVLVDAFVPDTRSVCTDDRGGAALAMQHALAAHPDVVVVLSFLVTVTERERVLAYKSPPRSGYVGSERVAGYARAARAAGFPAERILWLDVDDQFPESAAQRIADMRDRIATGTRLAIVGMSDRLALAAQSATKHWRGIKVVSVVGFDDIPAAAVAGLTTVRQGTFHKGEMAVKTLLDDMKSNTVLPVELVVRNT
jgi:DNA-binding LacI/PurR family transcriptional regulator